MIVFKESQSSILNTLQRLSGIVDRRHTLPILSNLLIQKNAKRISLITSDLEIQIENHVEWNGDDGELKITVGMRKLIDIVRSISPEQEITLLLNENKLVLSAGKSRFVLQTMPAENFPLVREVQEESTLNVQQKDLSQLLKQVSFAMATNDIRYYLNGLLFVLQDEVELVATDAHRLAWVRGEKTEGLNGTSGRQVILPRKTILELQRLLDSEEGSVEIQFSSNQARFNFNGLKLITKLVDGKFPDYKRAIPEKTKESITLGRQTLLTALQRASILMNEKFKGVRLNVEAGVIRVNSINSENEETVEEVDVDYQGPAVEMGFNVIYLIDALSSMDSEMVTMGFSAEGGSVVFTLPNDPDNFKFVIMPMKV